MRFSTGKLTLLAAGLALFVGGGAGLIASSHDTAPEDEFQAIEQALDIVGQVNPEAAAALEEAAAQLREDGADDPDVTVEDLDDAPEIQDDADALRHAAEMVLSGEDETEDASSQAVREAVAELLTALAEGAEDDKVTEIATSIGRDDATENGERPDVASPEEIDPAEDGVVPGPPEVPDDGD